MKPAAGRERTAATFQRARSAEQREERRRTILGMLDEMPVAEVTLNELSRRVGLAKSNVLRYFESREAVLLELLDRALGTWLAEVAVELAGGVDPSRNVSVDVAVRFKRSALAGLDEMAELVRRYVPETGEEAKSACFLAMILTGGLWTQGRPSASMLAAYEQDPASAEFRVELHRPWSMASPR
ncbi:TetR/AcrR family transcriptional regulator [Amycolatopsis sp. NPDC005003]